MKKTSHLALLGALACATAGAQAPEVTLTRMDCSGPNATPSDVARFSDTYAYEGKKVQLTGSCYLIKHGSDYKPLTGSMGEKCPEEPKGVR